MAERTWWTRALVVGAAVLVTSMAAPVFPDALQPSFSLYGQTGLVDMPSAEMQPDGETSWTFSSFGPTQRNALNFQFLEGVELTLRYTNVDDWTPAGTRIFTDALDLKLRLREETASFPAIALGFRDVLGTGVESAEYLVATKTVNPALKVTAGLGWGRLGANNGFGNPLGLLSDRFDTRPPQTGTGGGITTNQYFRGDAALFAGLEWQTPVKGLTFKAEYSSDDYARTALNSGLNISTPFNFGVEYHRGNGLALGAYLMQGSEVGLRLSLSGNPFREPAPQDFGAGPTPVLARPDDAGRGGGWAADPAIRNQLMEAISKVLAADGIVVLEASLTPQTVEVRVDNTKIRREPKAIGRVARILAVAMPASVRTFRITLVRDGVPTTTTVIDRDAFESQVGRPDAGPASWQSVQLEDADFRLRGGGVWQPEPASRFSWSVRPFLPLQFVSDSAVSYRLQLQGSASLRIAPGVSINGSAAQTVVGNIDSSTPLPPAGFPRVRSDYAAYGGNSGPELSRLTADYVFKLSDSTYGRISGGYLERMFGGVSGEVLWKPVNQSWGLGAEINYAKQRDFDNALSFRDYDVTTGHGSFYWDTGYRDIEVQVDAGRYLGGDWGATLTVSRRLPNGWEVAGYLTGTEATAQVSGSGNFQRGIRVTIPLRWALPFETRSAVSVNLNDGVHDDGARLAIANRLYRTVRDTERQDFYQTWGSFWQ